MSCTWLGLAMTITQIAEMSLTCVLAISTDMWIRWKPTSKCWFELRGSDRCILSCQADISEIIWDIVPHCMESRVSYVVIIVRQAHYYRMSLLEWWGRLRGIGLCSWLVQERSDVEQRTLHLKEVHTQHGISSHRNKLLQSAGHQGWINLPIAENTNGNSKDPVGMPMILCSELSQENNIRLDMLFCFCAVLSYYIRVLVRTPAHGQPHFCDTK